MNWLRHWMCILFFSSLLSLLSTICAYPITLETSDICITVFVHGIISVQPYLSLTNIVRLKRDRIGNSVYARAVKLTREDTFFRQHHAMQDLGLQKVAIDIIAPGMATTAFTRAYDTMAKKTGYAHEKNIYYTFGWSGLVSSKMRAIEAEIFYTSLLELLEPYHKKEIFPKLRIIGYSHGGRIALELAAAQYLIQSPIKIIVDELIFIGMPVSPSDLIKIQNHIFKEVYHIYSEGDRVQRIDFFSAKGFLSNRTFKSSSCFTIPKKLTQINYKVFRLARFYKKKWKGYLPIHPLGRKYLRKAHPGHIELWSFGWTFKNYRQNLPYYPLPGASFIPYIIQAAVQAPCGTHHVIVELHPYNSSIIVRTKGKKPCTKLPFLSQKGMLSLRNDALLFKPNNFTKYTFEEHSKTARIEAKRQKQKEWFIKRGKICRIL